VAKELGVDIRTIGLDGDLEHLQKLLFEIITQMLHLHCLCHYLSATDPTKCPYSSAMIHLKHVVYYYCSDYCTIFDVDYVVRKKRTLYLNSSRM
jgi:hypothetical protein